MHVPERLWSWIVYFHAKTPKNKADGTNLSYLEVVTWMQNSMVHYLSWHRKAVPNLYQCELKHVIQSGFAHTKRQKIPKKEAVLEMFMDLFALSFWYTNTESGVHASGLMFSPEKINLTQTADWRDF